MGLYLAQLTESEALAILESVCAKYQISVLIDPENYTIHSPAAVDVEHDEFGNMVGIGVYDGKSSLYFTTIRPSLVAIFAKLELIAHNGIGDMECLRSWGIPVQDSQLIWDTELIAHILDSSRIGGYGLKTLALANLGLEYLFYEDLVGKHKGKSKTGPKCPQTEPGCCGRRTLDKWPVRVTALYNALDCWTPYQISSRQKSVSNSAVVDYFQTLEQPASRVFSSMMNRGIRVDLNYLKSVKADLEEQKRPIKETIENELGPINLNSPKQLLEALHAKEIWPELKGKPSTDKRALERFKGVGVVDSLLRFSELETLLSSFVYPYLERNQEIVKPFFNQCGTRTGRPSCSNPNLLQIPRRTENGKLVRRMFIPREGFTMGDCDFGQIEPRVLAHLSKDADLCQMFNAGVDFHDFTATRLKISRDRAKILNLSVGYRATFKSVSSQLKCSQEEAEAQIDAWWSMFPQLRRWQESLIFESKRSGFCTTLLGRRIRVDGLSDPNPWKREAAERQLINNITQGSAAEIMKMAMIRLASDARLSQSFGLLVQIYDELVWESVRPEQDKIFVIEDMVNSVKLGVPLTVDCKTGANWAECH